MKNHDLKERSTRRTSFVAGGLARATLILAMVGALVGCGSSSSGGAFGEFEGTWRVDFGNATTPSPSTFRLTCPTAGTAGSPFWDKFVLEQGTVSDLTETSGPDDCQFAFDVTGKVATTPASDPYTQGTTQCTTLIDSGTDAAGNFHLLLFEMRPTAWTFSLLQPVKGAAPTAQFLGSAAGRVFDINTTTNVSTDVDTACTYAATVSLEKISQ